MDGDPSTAQRYVAKTGLTPFSRTTAVGTDPALIAEAAGADRRQGRIAVAVLVMLAVVLLALLLVPGLLLWLPSRDDAASRANLGASLLGGAVVAFSVMAVEVLVLQRAHRAEAESNRRAERAALQLQLSLQDDFRGLDVTGRDLSNFYLRRKDLSGARLVGANLEAADLSYATMADANLAGARLDYVQLRGTDLSRAALSGAHAWSADLTDANLEAAFLQHTELALSTLTGATLRNADLRGANLNSCNLAGANLEGARLDDARLFTLLSDEGTTWPAGFDPDEHGVTRLDRKWARLITSAHRARYGLTYDEDGRILELQIHD